MHRFIIVALAVLSVVGCNRFPDNGLQIAGMIPPDDDCTVSADTEVRLARGLWDVAVARNYVISPLLLNLIISTAIEFQAETNNLQVTNFEITILLPDGTRIDFGEGFPNPYRVDTSAVIPVAPEGGESSEVAVAYGIPVTYQQAVADAAMQAGFPSVLLDIRAEGTTMGGLTQKSGSFFWPVDLCNGCLQAPAAACDPMADEVLETCRPGQDGDQYCP